MPFRFKKNERRAVRTAAYRDGLRDGIAELATRSASLVTELHRIGTRLEGGRAGETTGLTAFALGGKRREEATELGKLVALRSSLEESTETILEAGKVLRTLKETSGELPLLWPLKGRAGHVSMLFGYNPNPFTGLPYLHLGLDLGTYRTGDPVTASADGIVLAASYDIYSGYGNNVIIRHAHGFYTRYAHLESFAVRAGARVRQGDVIGRLGGTGKVDAPHLHYEVRLGPEILDPLPFIVLGRPPESRRLR